MMQSVAGEMKAEKLKPLPLLHTTWGEWKRRHPGTLVLSSETGHRRDYKKKAYAGYEKSDRVLFLQPDKVDRSMHPKTRVVGVTLNGSSMA
jgi:hypothetical protein